MLTPDVPASPWLKVGMDFFANGGRTYVVMSDCTSNWVEVKELQRVTAAALIQECRIQFARHGVPLQVMADSGSQFMSDEFKKFAKEWNFEVINFKPTLPTEQR